MIPFTPIRTRRLSVQLSEIGIEDAILLASVPEERYEAQTSQFLAGVVESAETPTPQHVADPRAWTVQERAFVVAHYLAHVADDGPNFSCGVGRYTDYLLTTQEHFPSVDLGIVGDDNWRLVPMVGAAAETIEALSFEPRKIDSRTFWLFGCMAASLRLGDEVVPDPVTDTSYVDWLRQRMAVVRAYPESVFAQLMLSYFKGMDESDSFFKMTHGEGGLVIEAKPTEAGDAMPPTRFLTSSCISEFALGMGGKLAQLGS